GGAAVFFSFGGFMTRLSSLSASEKQFIDAAVFAAERAKGARLSGPEKKKVLATARQQIISQRDANRISRQRHEAAQERLFEWKKPSGFRR
ncbi:hypothetical protein, partial [Pectobacterium odoriferum]